MASVKEHKSHDMGLHQEVLTGRTQQVFFNPEESENFLYNDAYDVDFNKRTSIDVEKLNCIEVNSKIKDLMKQGYGTIVLKNPGAKHSLGVGILNKLNLIIEGSLGYFGVGSIDGPVVRISGRVGWSCAENMMAGKVVIEKNAGSCFGAAIRGGDLICKGSVGARSGIDMKGGTIMIGGNAGAFTGFMMQRGRIVILGDVGPNLGDSLYDGTIFVGGKIESLGADAVEAEMTDLDVDWLKRKLKVAEIDKKINFSKIMSNTQLSHHEVLNYLLLLQWDDGSENVLPLKPMRDNCPCAHCAGAVSYTHLTLPTKA